MAKRRKKVQPDTLEEEAPKKKRGMSRMLVMVVAASVASLLTGVVTVKWADSGPQVLVHPNQIARLAGYAQEWLASAPAGDASTPTASQPPADGQLAQAPIVVPPVASPAQIPAAPVSVPATASLQPVEPRSSQSIRIASFNIQVFGTSKLQKPKAMQVLTSIVRQFDAVAIQEVRSTDDSVIPTFVSMINSQGAQYDFVIGPRLGRTNSKEQYAIVFDTARLEVARSQVYTVPDPQDRLHREPMVARFRVRGVPQAQAFTFSLVDIHTDPDETKSELDALADVFVGVQQNGSGEDDVILLGDLNVDEYHLGNLGRLPGIGYAITKVTTNTRRNKMYDNIVFSRPATVEYTGRWGVVDLMSTFGLSEAEALEVSDHCPVWAEFSAYESANGRPVAATPTTTR